MERTIFDRGGHPVAYVADDGESSIYLWNGHAVCYLYGDKIYGWQGHHIGWFVNDILYDIYGSRVGFMSNTCPSITSIEPVKSVKYIKCVKCVRYTPYARPTITLAYSPMSLYEFLVQDAIGL